ARSFDPSLRQQHEQQQRARPLPVAGSGAPRRLAQAPGRAARARSRSHAALESGVHRAEPRRGAGRVARRQHRRDRGGLMGGSIRVVSGALAAAAFAALFSNAAFAEGASLVAAAKSADHAAALAALYQKADPNVADTDGSTALLWAVHNDDVELVKKLLAAGA